MLIKNNKNPEKAVETQFPEVKTNNCAIEITRFSSNSQDGSNINSRDYENLVTRLRVLEEEAKKAASDGIIPISFKSTVPAEGRSNFTFNENPLISDTTDVLKVTVPFYNQLHNTLQESFLKSNL